MAIPRPYHNTSIDEDYFCKSSYTDDNDILEFIMEKWSRRLFWTLGCTYKLGGSERAE